MIKNIMKISPMCTVLFISSERCMITDTMKIRLMCSSLYLPAGGYDKENKALFFSHWEMCD